MEEDEIKKIWEDEDKIMDNGFDSVKKEFKKDNKEKEFNNLFKETRSIHFILKDVEDGISDFEELPPPKNLAPNLDLIPGRLTLFKYENKISERWNGLFLGEALSIRTVNKIRQIAEEYTKKYNYDLVIVDTSPSLGILNKIIVSLADGFIIPCFPDMFSLYGIKNIGNVLKQWRQDFNVCFELLGTKREKFPKNLVKFLGYTILNAKKAQASNSERNYLSKAQDHYVKQIPETITAYISSNIRQNLTDEMLKNPIGNNCLLLSHNTLPNYAQKYKKPMWALLEHDKLEINDGDASSIRNHRETYYKTKEAYSIFADDLLERIKTLDE